MPYINHNDRKKYDKFIEELIDTLTDHGAKDATMGDINYIFSKMIWLLFKENVSYSHGNSLMGVLECIKQEFYRRQLSKYEDEKLKVNSDII